MIHDPGGLVRLKLPNGVVSSAVFGGDRQQYRYQLQRTWAPGPVVLFVMMNPSTADPLCDDPTVAKCGRLARKWGYGGFMVGNTFAYRATDQGRLTEVDDPVGPDNDRHLAELASEAALVVFAYGKPKRLGLRARGPAVASALADLCQPHILRLCADGTPSHPLYLPECLLPVPWLPG